MIKGIIFDFDGTIFDSMSIWERVGVEYLLAKGYKPKAGLSQILKCMSLKAMAEYFRSEYKLPFTNDEIINGVNSLVENDYKNNIMPKLGIDKLLDRLKNMNIKMCIATATDRYLVEYPLIRCGLREYFSKILTCSEVGIGKENPLIYREALRLLGTNRNETLIFEDALYAIKTAKKDGFKVVGVYDEYEEDKIGVKEYSDLYIKGYEEFHSIINFIKLLGENNNENSINNSRE